MSFHEHYAEQEIVDRFFARVTSGLPILFLRAILAKDLVQLGQLCQASFLSPSVAGQDIKTLKRELRSLTDMLYDPEGDTEPAFGWVAENKTFFVASHKDDGTRMRLEFRPPACGWFVQISAHDHNENHDNPRVQVDPVQQLHLIAANARTAVLRYEERHK